MNASDAPAGASGRSGPRLVLHSSPWRLALQWITPSFLLVFGAWGLASGGSDLIAGVVLLLGLAAAGVVLLDLPVRSEFDAQGVTRVCPLRRHHLPWSRVVAVERTGGMPRRGKGQDGDPGITRGLAARTGPRRVHLLVDRRESHAEYGVLRDLLRDRATQLRAMQPPIDAAPAGRGPHALHRRES